jgi:hypothetical protein
MHVETIQVTAKRVVLGDGEWAVIRTADGTLVKTSGPNTTTVMPATHTAEAVSEAQATEVVRVAEVARAQAAAASRLQATGTPAPSEKVG